MPAPGYPEVMRGMRDVQLVEEHVRHVGIVMLSCVDKLFVQAVGLGDAH